MIVFATWLQESVTLSPACGLGASAAMQRAPQLPPQNVANCAYLVVKISGWHGLSSLESAGLILVVAGSTPAASTTLSLYSAASLGARNSTREARWRGFARGSPLHAYSGFSFYSW